MLAYASMTDSSAARSPEPLGLLTTACDVADLFPKADGLRTEFSSRGDRVTCRVALPTAASAAVPVVVVVGAAGSRSDDGSLEFASALPERGIAVATLDLSLHGARSSPKFSERLVGALATDDALDDNARALVQEFAQQSRGDLARAVEALASQPSIDGDRIGLLGNGVGANLVAQVASEVAGVRAIALFARSAPVDPEFEADANVAALAKDALIEAPHAPDEAVCAWFETRLTS